jgi:hypothetical protein
MFEDSLGWYLPSCTLMSSRAGYDLVETAATYLCECELDSGGRVVAFGPLRPPDERPEVPEDELVEMMEAHLTWIHEDAHFHHTLSLPIGLFMWNLNQFRRQLISALFLHLSTLSGEDVIGLPLKRLAQLIQEQGPSTFEESEILERVRQWELLEECQNTYCGTGATLVEEAIGTLYAAWHLMATRWHASAEGSAMYAGYTSGRTRLVTDLEGQAGVPPDPYLTPENLCEAHARLCELVIIRELGLPSEVKDRLVGTRMNDYCGPIGIIVGALGDEVDALAVGLCLDLSLAAPIDPYYARFWQSEMRFEDMHPGYRLLRLLTDASDEIREADWSNMTDAAYRELEMSVCGKLGWTTPMDLARVGRHIGYSATHVREHREFMRSFTAPNGERYADGDHSLEHHVLQCHRQLCDARLKHPGIFGCPSQFPNNSSLLPGQNPLAEIKPPVSIQGSRILPASEELARSAVCDYIGCSLLLRDVVKDGLLSGTRFFADLIAEDSPNGDRETSRRLVERWINEALYCAHDSLGSIKT